MYYQGAPRVFSSPRPSKGGTMTVDKCGRGKERWDRKLVAHKPKAVTN